ncbi:hypothetical protein [Sporohalobacter salinus]|uniref:hypothetical protein n=1 Tax=Sporohalobacter salinus TaxID=1494606 RepID=UPI0019609C9B|nr:hypothetical protein [Sporohalobacter salinus]MBM7622673.1 hypothetical protein [Sporohalobacter salinus]
MLHNSDIRTSKTETWFEKTNKNTKEKKNKSEENRQKNQKKDNISTPKNTNSTKKLIKNQTLNNFRQELINYRDSFVRIITNSNQQLDSFQGILARIEGDFITLINTPRITKIPIKKITAVITNPNKATTSHLSKQEVKQIIKKTIDTLFDLNTEIQESEG